MGSFDYDVVIVGSGFGGSVAALRAAEKGYRVGIMEAGTGAESCIRESALPALSRSSPSTAVPFCEPEQLITPDKRIDLSRSYGPASIRIHEKRSQFD